MSLDLFQLVYVSRALGPLSDADLRSLQAGASRFNEARGVTGALFVGKVAFLQVLEGPFATVSMLLDGRIAADPRHRDLRVVFGAYASERLYANWNMAVFRVQQPEIPYEELLEHLADAAFTPDARRAPIRLVRAFEEGSRSVA